VPAFVVTKAAAAMTEAGFAAAADDVVAAVVERNPTAAVARLYVDRGAGRGDWSFLDRLPALLKRGEGGREVLYAAADALGSPGHRGRLHELLARFGDELGGTIRGWAKAAGALVGAGDYEAAAAWAADWEARTPGEPWMVHSVTVAFRHLGRVDEARRVAAYAIGLPAEDPTTTDFRVWMAFEEALDGRADQAERHLTDVDEEDLDDVPRVLHALTLALLSVQRKGRSLFAEARERGGSAVHQYAPKTGDADLELSYRRWTKRLAHEAGGIAAWLWARFRGSAVPGD
jgi:hypothetical protein